MINQLLYLINQTFILNPYLILIMSIIALVSFVIFLVFTIFLFLDTTYRPHIMLDIIIPLTVIISPIIIIFLLKKNQCTIMEKFGYIFGPNIEIGRLL
jgi:hypothetical protein